MMCLLRDTVLPSFSVSSSYLLTTEHLLQTILIPERGRLHALRCKQQTPYQCMGVRGRAWRSWRVQRHGS